MPSVTPISGRSVAEVVQSVRALVDHGTLQAGSALPTVRALSETLGVNRNTVAAAYRQLAELGVVQGQGRLGTVVRSARVMRGEGGAAADGLVDLAGGNPDRELLPDARAALARAAYRPALYGDPGALPRLGEEAVLLAGDDVPADSGLSVAHGAFDAVERLLIGALVRGDGVAVEQPGYLAGTGLVEAIGLRAMGVPVDEAGMRADGLQDALERGAQAVVITPRAQNPTGASLDAIRSQELRQLLGGHPDVMVIEDDHLSLLAGAPYEPVRAPSTRRWALVRSMAKTLGPDLRVALIHADRHTTALVQRRLAAGVNWVSHLLQAAVAELLADPHTAELLQHASQQYAERRGRLELLLAAGGHRPRHATDGWNLWLPIAAEEAGVVGELRQRGWLVAAGSTYHVHQPAPAALRITTSTLTASAAERLSADLIDLLPGTAHPDRPRKETPWTSKG